MATRAEHRGRAFHNAASKAIGFGPRPFDWERDCLPDVERLWPAVVGKGRGEVIEPYVCIRCGREKWEDFGMHRPLNSGHRSCGGTVVKLSEVEATRAQEQRKFTASMMKVMAQESGHIDG